MAESKLPEPSGKISIFFALMCLAPMVYCLFFSVFCGLFGVADLFKCFVSPISVAYLVFYAAIAVLMYKWAISKYKSYDGTESSCDSLNSLYPIVVGAFIGLLLINAFCYPFVFASSAVKNEVYSFSLWSFINISVGSTFLIGLLFYILWLENLEDWLGQLPFYEKHLKMNLLSRFLLINVFSAIGLVALVIAPLFTPSNEGKTFMEVFVSYMLPASIIGLVLNAAGFFTMVKSLTGRIKGITNFAQKLAEGNYTMQPLVVTSREEAGLLVGNINSFYEATKKVLEGVKQSVGSTKESGRSLETQMISTNTSVQQIVNNIKDVKTLMETQSAGVGNVSSAMEMITRNIDMLNQSIESQSSAVEQSSAAVREMIANIQSVTGILSKNADSIEKLGSASDEGNSRVQEAVNVSERILSESSGLMDASNVIQNIAEQTNLLAMNAAIEAAHAGEAGKGFAVVADEIRKLAEQSNAQGKKISESLQNLDEVIKRVASSTKALQDQFAVIFDLAKTVKTQEEIVMNAMNEQNAGSSQIIDAMRSIDDSTISVKQGAAEMLAEGKTVSTEIRSLEQTSNSVFEFVEKMLAGTDSIVSNINRSSESSDKNLESIKVLEDMTMKFKLKV